VEVLDQDLDQVQQVPRGGGSSGCLQKIMIPVASGQVIDFTIRSGGSGGAPESSGSDGGTTTISIYGQSI